MKKSEIGNEDFDVYSASWSSHGNGHIMIQNQNRGDMISRGPAKTLQTKRLLGPTNIDKIVFLTKIEMHITSVLYMLHIQTWYQKKGLDLSNHIMII